MVPHDVVLFFEKQKKKRRKAININTGYVRKTTGGPVLYCTVLYVVDDGGVSKLFPTS